MERNGHMRTEEPTRVPPHDLDVERAVIGACLVSDNAVGVALSTLKAEDFYSEVHRIIFRGVQAAAREAKDGIDHLAVTDKLRGLGEFEKVGGRGYIFQIVESVPTAANAGRYATQIKEMARARDVIDAGSRLIDKAFSDEYRNAPEYAMSVVGEIARRHTDSRVVTHADAVDGFEALVRDRMENKGMTGIRTGIVKMDNSMGGLNKGCSYVIAARPGVGKSLLIGQIAQTAANQGYRVLLQTPEMSALMYLDRLAHVMGDVHYERARRGQITAEEELRLKGAARTLAKLPLYVDDHGTQTPSRIRANVMRYQPDILLVDYLQYVKPDTPNPSRNHEVGEISRSLTAIKTDFQLPVVLAAQLNRAVEARMSKMPNLSDLRDSGEIEQDADAVIFLNKPSMWDDSAAFDELHILCAKWRFGDLWRDILYLPPGKNWLVNRRGEVA